MDQPLRLPEYKNKEVDIPRTNRMNRMMKRLALAIPDYGMAGALCHANS